MRSASLRPPDTSVTKTSQRHADLCRGQAYTWRGVHRLDHVVDELVHVRCDVGDGRRRPVEGLLTEAKDRANHAGSDASRRAVNRCLTSSAVAS